MKEDTDFLYTASVSSKTSGDIICNLENTLSHHYLNENATSPTSCEGRLEYESDLEDKYNNAVGWTRTKSEAGRIEVTGSGNVYVKTVTPMLNDAQAATAFADAVKAAAAKCAGEGAAAAKCIETETAAALATADAAKNANYSHDELWIRLSLQFTFLITRVGCDNNPSNSPPCEDYEITEWPISENVDMPLKKGYRDGVEFTSPKNGATGHSYTI